MQQQREIPSAAKSWGLRQHTVTRRRNKEDGHQYHANVTRQMKGEPHPDTGEVAERWPVGEFSVRNILERWGAGRYTVDWFDKAGKRIDGWKFDVAEPNAPPARAAAAEEDDAGDAAAAALRLPKTQLEWFIYQQQREERADRRRAQEAREERDRNRQEAEERVHRDREFLATITANLAHPGNAAAAAGGVDMARELQLMKRELALTLREDGARLRQELVAAAAAAAAGQQDDDDDDGPETMGAAVTQAGVAGVEAMGEVVPDIVAGLLGKLKRWLDATGQPSDPATIKALVEAAHQAVQQQGAGAHTNGAG